MNYSIIRKSQLEGTHRMDAEYYQQEYLSILEKISRFDAVPLNKVVNRITQGPNPIFIESGKCCLNGRNIKNNRVEPQDANFVSDTEYGRFSNFKVIVGDILITLKGLGSIGKTGYVFEDIDCIFSRDVGLIRAKKNSELIYAFLLSKYGTKQIERSTTGGTGQLTLATSYIKSIKIPRFDASFADRIANLVKDSELRLRESKSFYQQAENLLLEELGLKDFQTGDDLSFIVNLSDIQSARRADAEFFQPKYEKLILKIKTATAKLLPEVIDDVAVKFNPQSRPDETFHYVELANVNLSTGVIDGSSEIVGKEAPSRAKRLLKTGDVIASSVEGSLGKVALASEEQNGYLASTGFFQFRSKLILPEVLLVLGKSIVLQMQLEKQCAGTILTAVPQDSLKNILIPILPIKTQQKIAALVSQSHAARRKSKALLEQAKREVEEMIESNRV